MLQEVTSSWKITKFNGQVQTTYNMYDRIIYSDTKPHTAWKEGWYSKSNKYPPITNFDDLECIEEITDWGDIECNVPSHTYVLNRAGHCCGYFIRNIITKENWVEFGRPSSNFSKARRKFKKSAYQCHQKVKHNNATWAWCMPARKVIIKIVPPRR